MIPEAWTDAEVSTETSAAVEALFDQLYDLELDEDASRLTVLDEAAKRLWIDWYAHHQQELKDAPDNLRGAWAKMPSQCGRLILITHLTRWAEGGVDNSDLIDEQSVACGTALAEYFKSHARRVYAVLHESPGERTLRRVVEWIQRKANSGIRPRDVQRARVSGIQKAEEAQAVLDQLVERGEGKWGPAEQSVSGQPSRKKFYLLK
jgi:hypothetical protein